MVYRVWAWACPLLLVVVVVSCFPFREAVKLGLCVLRKPGLFSHLFMYKDDNIAITRMRGRHRMLLHLSA